MNKNMHFKIVALLVAVSAVSTWSLPPCVCTRNLKYVCGSDGVTYNNQCLLDCEAFKGKQVAFVKEGSCDAPRPHNDNDCICTLEYKPVCGSDGVSYPNSCALECKQRTKTDLRVSHMGNCVSPVQECVCGYSYLPVCGSDGETYPNRCTLACEQKKKPNLTEVRSGRCDGQSEFIKIVE